MSTARPRRSSSSGDQLGRGEHGVEQPGQLVGRLPLGPQGDDEPDQLGRPWPARRGSSPSPRAPDRPTGHARPAARSAAPASRRGRPARRSSAPASVTSRSRTLACRQVDRHGGRVRSGAAPALADDAATLALGRATPHAGLLARARARARGTRLAPRTPRRPPWRLRRRRRHPGRRCSRRALGRPPTSAIRCHGTTRRNPPSRSVVEQNDRTRRTAGARGNRRDRATLSVTDRCRSYTRVVPAEDPPAAPFSRAAMLERLAAETFDVLVVGGGITGVGRRPRRRHAGPAHGARRGRRLRQRDVVEELQARPRRPALPPAGRRPPRLRGAPRAPAAAPQRAAPRQAAAVHDPDPDQGRADPPPGRPGARLGDVDVRPDRRVPHRQAAQAAQGRRRVRPPADDAAASASPAATSTTTPPPTTPGSC